LNSFDIPIHYAFRPPSIPNWALLLRDKNPVRRASYPDEVHEAGEDTVFESQTISYSLIVVYIFGLLV